MPKPGRIEFTLTPDERNTMNRLVEASGLTRQDFIRQRILTPPGIVKSPQTYANCVEAAARAYSGIPRTQMERIVAATLAALTN